MENPDAIGYPQAAAAPKVSAASGDGWGFPRRRPFFISSRSMDAVILATDEERGIWMRAPWGHCSLDSSVPQRVKGQLLEQCSTGLSPLR
jgi:hypothetical protein